MSRCDKPRVTNPFTKRTQLLAALTALLMTACSQKHDGTYSLHDPGLAPEIIKLDGKKAWIGTPDRLVEHRVIVAGDILRIESLEGMLRANYRLNESGLLCMEDDRFYRKGNP